MTRGILLAVAATLPFAAPLAAEEVTFNKDAVAAMKGDIVIEAPYAVSMKDDEIIVFMTIHNGADEDDVITAVSSDAAGEASLAKYEGPGKPDFERLEKIETPGNNAVLLDQGGYHVLLNGLKKPVEGGDTIPLILTFEETGDLEVEVSVAVMQ